jgi:MFS family permease
MIAFLSLFLVSRGFSRDGAGILMSITTVGVIAFQLPVSMLADRFGKRPLLLGCYGVVALGLATIPWLSTAVWFGTVLFVFGACTGAMYPLGLSLLGDRTVESGLARAYAWYLAVECFGSQAGAAAMGGARKVWGEDAMFAVGLGAAGAVLVIGVSLRLLLRDQRDSITSLDGDQRQAA